MDVLDDIERRTFYDEGNPRGSESAGDRKYKRDRDGQFSHTDERGGHTAPPPRQRGTHHEGHRTPPTHDREHHDAPSAPSPKSGPMRRGEKSGRVRELQRLLDALGIAKGLPADGRFGMETEKGVKILQAKLGMSQTGHVSAALMRRLRDAQTLSPCADAKRAQELDDMITRALDDLDEQEDDVEAHRAGPLEWGYSLLRSYPLEDIHITRSGDGRTVEAYAAIWDTPAEVRDQHGHYMEVISRGAFDKTIRERGDRIPVFYNHGMNLSGGPSDRWSVPIGRSVEIRAEERGLWTLSRYNDGPDADAVLEAIRNGAITSQSFRGRVFKSNPAGRIPKARGSELPMVTRTELGLAEYGPTPTAVYDGAAILALRSHPLGLLAGYDPQQLAELLTRTSTTPEEPETSTPTSDKEAGPEEPPTHSGRLTQSDIARRIRVEQILRSK